MRFSENLKRNILMITITAIENFFSVSYNDITVLHGQLPASLSRPDSSQPRRLNNSGKTPPNYEQRVTLPRSAR